MVVAINNRIENLNRLMCLLGYLYLPENHLTGIDDFLELKDRIISDISSTLSHPNRYVQMNHVRMKSSASSVEFCINFHNGRYIQIWLSENTAMQMLILVNQESKEDSDMAIYWTDLPVMQIIDISAVTQEEKQLISEILNIFPELKRSLFANTSVESQEYTFLDSLPEPKKI